MGHSQPRPALTPLLCTLTDMSSGASITSCCTTQEPLAHAHPRAAAASAPGRPPRCCSANQVPLLSRSLPCLCTCMALAHVAGASTIFYMGQRECPHWPNQKQASVDRAWQIGCLRPFFLEPLCLWPTLEESTCQRRAQAVCVPGLPVQVLETGRLVFAEQQLASQKKFIVLSCAKGIYIVMHIERMQLLCLDTVHSAHAFSPLPQETDGACLLTA